MQDGVVVLTREERDQVLKAVAAIHRQLKVMAGETQPHAPSLMVIGQNLAIIQATVGHVPLNNRN
jgi:hypothetical protein